MLKAIDNKFLYRLAAVFAVIAYVYTTIVLVHYSTFIMIGLCLVGFGIILAFTNFKPVYSLVLLIIPLSVEIPVGLGDSKILFPSEALIIVLGTAFIAIIFFFRANPKAFLSHPVTIVILLYMLVLGFTAYTSQQPVVSIKFTLVNYSYIMVFYFLTNIYVNKQPENGMRIYKLYGFSAFFVIVYALINHYGYGYNKNVSNLVVQPFYTDHAIYSACLAMLLPAFVAFGLRGRVLGLGHIYRLFAVIVLLAIIAGIVFSYSRAAWISLAVSAIFYVVLCLKIKPAYLMGVLFICGIIAFAQRSELINDSRMNHNSSTTSNPTIEAQTKSITNISNDVSNAERLNRWSCAYRMFLDKPITGFGPGTYQFQYLTYQQPSEMTRISVMTAYNNPLGKGGSAHSEYLLALSESGILGFLSIIAIVLSSVYYGMVGYYSAATEKERILIAVPFLAMLTYAVHVVFNNYLNVDKTASLFWASLSILVTVSSSQKRHKTKSAS
jgi:putative inorganic carbon (HCO3(-)) transporter